MNNNPQIGAFASFFGGQSQPLHYMPQQAMMPNVWSSFMPGIPGYQPNYMPQQPAVVMRGSPHGYPQYQHRPQPVFGPSQAVPAPQRGQQMIYQSSGVLGQSNPMAMMNLGGHVSTNNSILNGFGILNQGRRF